MNDRCSVSIPVVVWAIGASIGVILAASVASSAISTISAIPIKMLADLANTVLDFVRQHPNWAAFVVFAMAFGESLPLVSLIFPFWAALVGIGALVSAADPLISQPSLRLLRLEQLWVTGSHTGSATITTITFKACGP